MQTVPFFKKAAWAEGVSLLVLIFVAMPLKYFFRTPEAVLYTGWLHGVLFITYCVAALLVKEKLSLPFNWLVKAGIAGFIPFGTFIFVKKMLPA